MSHSISAVGRVRCLLLAAFGLAGAASGCSPESPGRSPRVAVTVAPLAGLVDRLTAGSAEVTVMIPPGGNPVTHEPAVSRLRAAASADLFVAGGHPAFTWETTWLATLERPTSSVLLSASDGCELVPDDPHVWLSVPCVRHLAGNIASALVEADPAAAPAIGEALDGLLTAMDSLEATGDRLFRGRHGAAFVALHPAWGYVAREYGLEQIAVLDHGTGDAGPAELARVVERARDLGLTDVVVQPQFSHEAATLVARELGGRIISLDPLAWDWVAAYGETLEALASVAGP